MRNYLNRQYVSVKVQQVVLTSNVSQRETNLGEWLISTIDTS